MGEIDMNEKCVVLNAKKMNFDGKLDFSILSSNVTVYDDTTEKQLLERIQGAEIIVTKEMAVSEEMIQRFPESVKLICEAGTGYNNIDLDAARKLDVQEIEPPEENSPLYTMDNVLLTPHMGWKGLETRQRLVSILADNIKKFMEGTPINVVSSL